MKTSKVIGILGGSGFVGRYVVRRLAKRGYLLKIGGRHIEKSSDLKTAGVVGQIQPTFADMRLPSSLEQFVLGCDVVVNLVGILFEKGKQTFDDVHHKGAEDLAKFAAKAGVKQFIHISALGADEKSESDYARTKGLAEKSVRKAFKEAVILRPSLIYGPDDNFFNRFAEMAVLSPFLPVFYKGETKFQPVYVDDLARAIEVLVEKEISSETFAVAGDEVYSFRDLLDFMLDVIGKKRAIIEMPSIMGYLIALGSKLLPNPLLTADQLKLLKVDNVVPKGMKTLNELGITPVKMHDIVPHYLKRFCG